MTLQPLDGPAKQSKITVTSSTVQLIKVGTSPQTERKIVTIQPKTGKIYIYFGDETQAPPSVATVIGNGLLLFKNGKETYEASNQQPIYILAVSSSVDVVIVERA